MTSKQELNIDNDVLRGQVVSLRREVNDLNREVTAAHAERDNLRAQLATRQADTPNPRPFRVGDRVRVSQGATFQAGGPWGSSVQGEEGVVSVVWPDGDLTVDVGDLMGCTSPEFCTLIEPEPEPTTPTPSVRVEVVYNDGTLGGFDGDMVEVSDDAPVYEVYKGGAFVACVSMMQTRSIAVVR